MPSIRSVVGPKLKYNVVTLFSDSDRQYYYWNARTAIQSVMVSLEIEKDRKILVPNYNCGAELDAIKNSGAWIEFYEIENDTSIDLSKLEKLVKEDVKFLYIINYFGRRHRNAKEIRKLCNERGVHIIEDCAMSLLTEDGGMNGLQSDIKFFSIYKFFPTLAGGVATIRNLDVLNKPIRQRRLRLDKVLKFYIRFLVALLAKRGISDLRRIFERNASSLTGEQRQNLGQLNEEMPKSYYFDTKFRAAKMPMLTKRQIYRFDVQAAIKKRRDNFFVYMKILGNDKRLRVLINRLDNDEVPLNFPIVVGAAGELIECLLEAGVPAVNWWSGSHRDEICGPSSNRHPLKGRVVALPLHEAVSFEDIERIGDVVRLSISAREKCPVSEVL